MEKDKQEFLTELKELANEDIDYMALAGLLSTAINNNEIQLDPFSESM